MKLIVGLGNPGKKYELTKHNIGFYILDKIASDLGVDTINLSSKFHGFFGEGNINGQKLLFLKPTTYMNLSGTSVQSVVSFYKIETDDILILHDEIDLDPGIIKYKKGGGSAGHNGLKDISQKLGSPEFHRIRIGVGRPNDRSQVADYVLSNISKTDKDFIMEKYFDIKIYVNEFIEGDV